MLPDATRCFASLIKSEYSLSNNFEELVIEAWDKCGEGDFTSPIQQIGRLKSKMFDEVSKDARLPMIHILSHSFQTVSKYIVEAGHALYNYSFVKLLWERN